MKERNTKEYRMKQVFDQNTLHERESFCIQEEPAWCISACPIHLDARKLCAQVTEGDFSGGLSTIESVTPFTGILAGGCEAPCQKNCKLAEIGDGIDCRSLEQACVSYSSGKARKRRKLPMMSKKKSVAVCGNDLFSLAVCGELVKKSYTVTLYCGEEDLAAVLYRQFPDIAQEAIEKDLTSFKKLDIKWNKDEIISSERLIAEYDVLCLSAQYCARFGLTPADPTTLYTGEPKIFGGLENRGVIYALMDSKIAASSIDRYIQNVPLNQDREKERPYETRLYTSLDGVPPSRVLTEEGSLAETSAIAEAQRCIQCECLECVKACAYLQHFKRYPKQTLREIYNNLSIVMGNHMANGLINACALCDQCVAICPTGFNLPEVCQIARDTMVETEKMPPSAHEFALLDMQFSMSDEFFLAKHQQGYSESRYLFFPGCQMGAVMPQTLMSVYDDLATHLEGGVGLMLGCCGAMAFWAGQTHLFDETVQKLRRAWEKLGSPKIIAGCPTCRQMLKTHLTEDVSGIWDYLDETAPKITLDQTQYVVQDACGARFEPAIQDKIRHLAEGFGLNLTETTYSKDTAPCCGYGGLLAFADRETASEMTAFAAGQSPLPALSYCANCRDRFGRQNPDSLHLLELFYGKEPGETPTLSKRRLNRKMVRRTLLQKHWNETMAEKNYDFTIDTDSAVIAKMEDRMILDEDIYTVIQNVRDGSPAIYEKSSDTHLTSSRIGNITFWVRYVPDADNVYRIVSVYSHRMQVVEV